MPTNQSAENGRKPTRLFQRGRPIACPTCQAGMKRLDRNTHFCTNCQTKVEMKLPTHSPKGTILSRQQIYQLKQKMAGNCIICGARRKKASDWFCNEHENNSKGNYTKRSKKTNIRKFVDT